MGILSKFPVGDSSQPFKIRAFVEGGKLSAQNKQAYAVAFGDDKFVAVGDKLVSYSADGITWTEGTLPADCINATFRAIAHGNGRFVAVGYDNSVSDNLKACAITSTNGINWTSVTLPEDKYWHGICRGPNKFVAVGWRCAATSTDGVTWEKRSIYDYYWNAVTYGKNKYAAVAESSGSTVYASAVYSTTGISWSFGENYLYTNQFNGIAYGNGRYVAVGSGKYGSITNKTMTSTDGITWSEIVMPNGAWECITFSDDMFVAGGSNAESLNRNFAVSLDGLEWKALASQSNHTVKGITYGNGRFVGVCALSISLHSI